MSREKHKSKEAEFCEAHGSSVLLELMAIAKALEQVKTILRDAYLRGNIVDVNIMTDWQRLLEFCATTAMIPARHRNLCCHTCYCTRYVCSPRLS